MANKLKTDCFDIVNLDGKPVLYRTDDVTLNKITFSIINATGAPLKLTGGDPVNQLKLSAGENTPGSSFNFNFESMLIADVVKELTLTLEAGWDKAFFDAHDDVPASWSIAPKDDITLDIDGVVKVEITNIKCSTTNPGNFEILYFNVPDYANPSFPITKHLDVTNPPDIKKKTLPLLDNYINPVHPIQGQSVDTDIDFDDFDVVTGDGAVPIYITYDPGALIQNGFTYILTNTSKDPLVPPGGFDNYADLEDAEKPVLYISFLFGTEDYEITTQDLADNNISIDVKATLPWQPAQHTAGTSYWQFFPTSPLVMDKNETVYFPINKIITQLNVTPDAISVVYIQFNNVPGYNDGTYSLQMQKKVAVASMDKLEASSYNITYGENITLTWVSSLAKRVTIEYKDRDGNAIMLDSDKGQIKLDGAGFTLPTAPSAEQTVIRATAYDNTSVTSSKDITVTVKQLKAEIKTFTANPQLADVTQTVNIVFTWDTLNAKTLVLSTPKGDQDVTGQTTCTFNGLQKTFEFALNAYSYGTQFPAPTKNTLRVFAYRPGNPIPLPMTSIQMQTFPAILVNNKYGRVYAVDNSTSKIYDIDIATPTSSIQYDGVVIAVSADETKLFVYNPNPANFGVSIMDVASKSKSGNVGFGPVYQMIVSPDLTKLYCAATHNVNTVTLLNVNAGNNSMSVGPTITVGQSPRAMVFNKDATKLYVANYDSHNVSVIKVADNSVTSFDIQTTEPTTFAYKASADKLYLACEGENYVVVIDTVGDSVLTKVAVKNRPSNVILSPNGQYVYVANFGSNTVSVIDTSTDQVTVTLTVGQSPLGMGLNGDGTALFVGNYCDRTVSVVDVNSNVVLPQVLTTGNQNGNPFDMAVYTEGNDYSRVYVAKESFPPRVSCSNPDNTSLDISVYSIQKP